MRFLSRHGGAWDHNAHVRHWFPQSVLSCCKPVFRRDGIGNDAIEIVVARLPGKRCPDARGIGNEPRHIAEPARCHDAAQRLDGNPVDRIEH